MTLSTWWEAGNFFCGEHSFLHVSNNERHRCTLYMCRSFRKLWSDGGGESRPRKVRLFVRPLWNEFAWKCGNVRTYVNSAVAYWQREPANFDLVIEQTEWLSNLRLTHSFQLPRRCRRRYHIPMCACLR